METVITPAQAAEIKARLFGAHTPAPASTREAIENVHHARSPRHHKAECGPYCAIVHCACGDAAAHGRNTCSKCSRGSTPR